MTSLPWQNGRRAKTNLPFPHWLGWDALSQQQAAQLAQPPSRRITGSRALRSDELTNQITVVSSNKSKSRHGREFYVTQETKHSRYHQSLPCIPTLLSLWHTCLVFLQPCFCLVPEDVQPAHMEDRNTEGLVLLRGGSTQCLRRGGIWTPQFPPPSDSNSGTHICMISLDLHRNTNPGAQRMAMSTHPFLAAFLSTVQLPPLGFTMKLFCCRTLIAEPSGKSIAIREWGWFRHQMCFHNMEEGGGTVAAKMLSHF